VLFREDSLILKSTFSSYDRNFMVRIYTLKRDLSYQDLTNSGDAWKKYLWAFNGESHIKTWKPLATGFSPHTSERPRGDVSSLNSTLLVLTRKAINVLQDVINETGELLPLICDEEPLWAFNVTNVLEGALDLEQSSYKQFDTGHLYGIKKYVFKEDVVADQYIFRESKINGQLFVTDRFRNIVEDAGLLGFEFEAVYPESAVVPRTPKRAPRPKPSNLTTEAVTSEDRELIQGSVSEGLAHLKLTGDEPAKDIIDRIAQDIDAPHTKALPEDEVAEYAAMLGVLWGEQVCRAYGWQWMHVGVPERMVLSVVAPEQTHYIEALHLIWELVLHKQKASRVILAFNMLRPDSLVQTQQEQGALMRVGLS
jgi:hypothetical protein